MPRANTLDELFKYSDWAHDKLLPLAGGLKDELGRNLAFPSDAADAGEVS